MTQTQAPAAGGQFLTAAAKSDEVFIREDLTEEQRLFGRTAAEFMQKEVLPVVERLYKHDWALTRQLLKKASDLDLLRLEIPAEYGGLGLDLISASYVGEQIAINPSFGGSLGANTSIGTLPLVYFGTEEQKARYLPKLASGELIGAYALTEPQSGSDALAARTSATLTPDGKHYVLNGTKMWITNGGFADLFTVFAKVAGMVVRGFVGEAMWYRTLGDVDKANEGHPFDGLRVMKTIESFSVECSINKVWTSEALAWAVDESIQVFGGNGYSREFPAERMYRDARITRIYEGTNEINRMLIPGRLLKQSPDSFTAEAARTALSSQPAPAASHQSFLERAKRAAVGLLGTVSSAYGAEL